MLRQHSRALRSQEIPVPAACWSQYMEARGEQEGTGHSACWEIILSWAGTSVTWAPSPALPHPPRTALGVPLQVLLAGIITLHQVCPSIKSFPGKPRVPPSPPSIGYW